MRKKSVGKSFRKINLAHTDDFGPKNDKIRLWVINNGGTFSKELNDGVTHLVCSRKAWKGYHNTGELTPFKTILQPITSTLPHKYVFFQLTQQPTVQDARRRRIKVVNLDWLEDSLLSTSKRPKPERDYEWDTISKTQQAEQRAHQIAQDNAIRESIAKFGKQCIDFETTMQTTGYHPYTDPDGFCYSILLVRTFLLENRLEKLSLKLFESDAIPHAYACYVKYTRKGASGREILAIPGSSWDLAFDAFRKFFKTKTRKDWNDRLDGNPAPSSSDGNLDDPFRYEPPSSAHEPKGLVEQKTRSERAKQDLADRAGSVTMIVPTIEISDDEGERCHLNVQACTPEGVGW